MDAFANYSMDTDMKSAQVSSYFKDLHIPTQFVIGNKRVRVDQLVIEGTDVVDFDKLLNKSYHLLLFRDNAREIENTWAQLLDSIGDLGKSTLNFSDLQKLDADLRTSISDTLLLDMVAVATEGQGLDITMTDFAYIMGKLGQLTGS